MLLASTTRLWEVPPLCGEYAICRTVRLAWRQGQGQFLAGNLEVGWFTLGAG